MKKSYKKLACKAIAYQYLTVLISFVLLLPFLGREAVPILWGGVVVALPNFCFALYFFSGWRQRSAKQIMLLFYVGEVFKMISCGLLAIFFVKLFHLSLGMLVVGMAVAYIAFWLIAPFMMQQQNRVSV